MTDESIINLSDETKSSLRIYAMMAGFFVIFAANLYSLVASSTGQLGPVSTVNSFAAFILLFVGVALALLHKRDLIASYFIIYAFATIIVGSVWSFSVWLIVGIVELLLALAFLQSRNEQRYSVCGLLIIGAVAFFLTYLQMTTAAWCVKGLIIIATFYFSIALACERYKLPLRDMLVADEGVPENDGVPVHFKEMGSSIGYAMIAFFCLSVVFMAFDMGVTGEQTNSIKTTVGLILVMTGIIMMSAGRMKGTPFYFICLGFLFFMMSAGSLTGMYVESACLIILGVMMMLRMDSRFILGAGMILMGVAGYVMRLVPDMGLTICGIINIVISLILIYLVFAVNSNGKLKLI